MTRIQLILTASIAFASSAFAHFPFVVPADSGATAKLIMSETLEPDGEVSIDLLKPTKLFLRDASGKEIQLTAESKPDQHFMTLALPGGGTRVVHGVADLGVMQRGKSPAHLLVYYPKTLIGDAFDPATTLGGKVPVELIPTRDGKSFKLKLVANGKPLANSDIRILTPDGVQDDYKTDDNGLSPAFESTGRYAAWARHWIDTTGERDSKPYTQLRNYATLVFDVPAPASTSSKEQTTNDPRVTEFARLPEAVASFGAVATDGWLYVYGGHVAERHDYSTAAVSGKLHRISLSDASKIESLAAGPGVQGMNLAAHDGKIYRVGGMEPRNAPGEPQDNYSRADVARYDPTSNKWDTIATLPTPRSSHDIAISGGKLYIIGGWNMRGQDEDNQWITDALVLDLANPTNGFKKIEQPFSRRALIVAALDKKIYVLGGFDNDDKPHLTVDILDTTTSTWSKGPDIPGRAFNGFSPAACVKDGKLYLSVGSGEFYVLSDDGTAWNRITKTTPRIVHRLVPSGSRILIVGGARGERMTDLIEAVDLD